LIFLFHFCVKVLDAVDIVEILTFESCVTENCVDFSQYNGNSTFKQLNFSLSDFGGLDARLMIDEETIGEVEIYKGILTRIL
jgi:hypothetical protein